jgi:hypothetical protein
VIVLNLGRMKALFLQWNGKLMKLVSKWFTLLHWYKKFSS